MEIELQLARYRGQKRKPANLAVRPKNAPRSSAKHPAPKEKSIHTYIYVHVRCERVLVTNISSLSLSRVTICARGHVQRDRERERGLLREVRAEVYRSEVSSSSLHGRMPRNAKESFHAFFVSFDLIRCATKRRCERVMRTMLGSMLGSMLSLSPRTGIT